MSIACETTIEQKQLIFKNYKKLLTDSRGSSEPNFESKPNVYVNLLMSNKIGQTSRTQHDDDFWSKHLGTKYTPYFNWISFEELQTILNKELMKIAKIKF